MAGILITDLRSRRFTLLETLLRHPDQVLSREQLLSHVRGYDFDPTSNVVNVVIAALRSTIGNDRIETIRGAGYRLLVFSRFRVAGPADGGVPVAPVVPVPRQNSLPRPVAGRPA